ncbi:MAG: hypothetical protein AB9891_09925 [Anaerolineaceae bacterium]
MKKTIEWLKKLTIDSFTKALAIIISNFIVIVFVIFFTITLPLISKSLTEIIQVPLFILLTLAFFSLIGVLIPSKKIIEIISEKRKLNSNKQKLERIKFENTPREWSTHLHFDGFKWVPAFEKKAQVFCLNHNMSLRLQHFEVYLDDFDEEESEEYNEMEYLISVCPECRNERINYYGSGPFKNRNGFACHCPSSQERTFLSDVDSRLIRKASQ